MVLHDNMFLLWGLGGICGADGWCLYADRYVDEHRRRRSL